MPPQNNFENVPPVVPPVYTPPSVPPVIKKSFSIWKFLLWVVVIGIVGVIVIGGTLAYLTKKNPQFIIETACKRMDQNTCDTFSAAYSIVFRTPLTRVQTDYVEERKGPRQSSSQEYIPEEKKYVGLVACSYISIEEAQKIAGVDLFVPKKTILSTPADCSYAYHDKEKEELSTRFGFPDIEYIAVNFSIMADPSRTDISAEGRKVIFDGTKKVILGNGEYKPVAGIGDEAYMYINTMEGQSVHLKIIKGDGIYAVSVNNPGTVDQQKKRALDLGKLIVPRLP